MSKRLQSQPGALKRISRRKFLTEATGTAAALTTLPRPAPAASAPERNASLAGAGSLTVGNRLMARIFALKEGQAFTITLKARSEVNVVSREFAILCERNGRKTVFDSDNSSLQASNFSPSGREAELVWTSDQPPLEIHAHYRADEDRPYIFKWLEVTNRGEESVRLLRVTVEALEADGWLEPLHGGVGQPVLLGNEFFFGIEHPAGENDIRGHAIVLSHHPEAKIAPGATWGSQRAVVGAVAGDLESVEDAFRSYLVAETGRPPKARPIFCDWAAHDELGTLVKPQLTQELTQQLLDSLDSLKSKYGIQFDYYLFDAFWYDPKGAYLTFKRPNWPHGYEPSLRRILELGMKPGLWFDLGGSTLDLKNTPGWNGPEKPCLSDPQFAELLDNAIAAHIREHSLSLLKFDFADLYCHHDPDPAPSLAVLERNADSLRRICDRARQLKPGMTIRAFNSFSLNEIMISTLHHDEAYAVSPWWLFWFDSLYSGDPRPSDLPSVTSLRDSVNWYQDHAFRGFARCLMPLFTIDDCGTLVGKTSTIYYLGAEGFTDSWILNIMRGDLTPFFYGDLRLLNESDRQFLAATLRFLSDHQGVLARTKPILGIPGKGEVYGYLARDGQLALITVVNPGLFPQPFHVPTPGPDSNFAKLVFANDQEAEHVVRPVKGFLDGSLFPGEIRLYALGRREKIAPLSLPSAPTRVYHQVAPMLDPFQGGREAQLRIEKSRVGSTLAFIVQYYRGGELDRSYKQPQEVLKVVGELGGKPAHFASIPGEGVDVWSQCSWAVFKHRVSSPEAGQTLALKLLGSPPDGVRFQITALWLS